ncbi:hypothetical protein AB6N01_12035 [Alcaligenes nematophilus]|uniref:hypothetical protein n=1 Tax=Alcaligenes nematophilus TaxID=2994643 RepID=UPI0034E07456
MTKTSVMPSRSSDEVFDHKLLQSLEKENRILFDQLQTVQEELERLHHYQSTEVGAVATTVVTVSPVDPKYLETLAEKLRLEMLLKVQGELSELQARYALSSQLGEVLIEGTRSLGALLAMPGQLRKAWRKNQRRLPPELFGGKSFDKVLQVYQEGGEQQVENLFSQNAVPDSVRASAWTAVARTVMLSDPALAAVLAERAFALEPRGFRQKWLTFRLHEAGDLLRAEALLALLPQEVTFTSSETRQRERLLKQAQQYRIDQVDALSELQIQQRHVEQQWAELTQTSNAFAATVELQRKQLVDLQSKLQGLEQERNALVLQERQLNEQALAKQTDLARVAQAQAQQQSCLLQEQISGLRQALEQGSQLLTNSQSDNARLRDKLGLLELRLAEKESESSKWFEQCTTVQNELAEMVVLVSELSQKIEALRKETESSLSEIEALTVSRDAQALAAAQQLKESMSFQEQLAALVLEREQLIEQREQELVDRQALQTQLVALTNERDEQAYLAAQRQGELLQQSRDLLALEKSRAELEARYRDMERQFGMRSDRDVALIGQLSAQLEASADREIQMQKSLEEQFKKQSDDLIRVRRYLETVVKNNSSNTVRQVQSFAGMQEYFATGVLPAFHSEAHTWPVSADFALCLIQRLVFESYDLVVEFGSGISTFIVAKTLAVIRDHDEKCQTQFVSFEHLDSYFQQTLERLQQADFDKNVQLILAPFENWQAADGQIYPYYSCQGTLAKLAKQKQVSRKRILVIVNGPPAATGPQARYPAGPLLMEYFPDAYIDFLMDDYIREDEKQVAKHWLADLDKNGRSGTLTEYKLEKDACLIAADPKEKK